MFRQQNRKLGATPLRRTSWCVCATAQKVKFILGLSLCERLEEIDCRLRESGVERDFVERTQAIWKVVAAREASAVEPLRVQQRSRRATLCRPLCTLLPEDIRRHGRSVGR